VGVLLKENKMAFQSGNLALIEGANSNAGRLWTYKYTTDSLATISASAYFSTADTVTGQVAADLGLLDEDVINIQGSDGIDTIVVNITSAGVVSVVTDGSGRTLVRAEYVWDVNINEAAGAAGTAGTYGLGVIIPDDAVITGAWYEVLETFHDTGTDQSTVAIQALAANDLLSALALDAGTALDAANPTILVEMVPVIETPSTFIKMSSAKELKLLLATGPLDGGELLLYVEYVQSRAVTA
jgi:hypothetical protein